MFSPSELHPEPSVTYRGLASPAMAEEDDSYWQDSAAKGFSWDDQEDTVGLPQASISSMSGR